MKKKYCAINWYSGRVCVWVESGYYSDSDEAERDLSRNNLK